MAAELIEEALLSPSLEVLFEKMASGDVYEFIGRIKLEDCLLKKLKNKLLSANSVLNDGEGKQIKNKAVREWLAVAELEEAIYDAEDSVDEIHSEALRWKIDGESGSSSHQV
nr:putative disease resistance protein At3g14460 isoform X2 [Ziziphus jujuba var. spinosa]